MQMLSALRPLHPRVEGPNIHWIESRVESRSDVKSLQRRIISYPVAMDSRSFHRAACNPGYIPTEVFLTKYITVIVRSEFCSLSLRSTVRNSCPSLCNAHVSVDTLVFRTWLSPVTWTDWRELPILMVVEIFRTVIQVEFNLFLL
jgi:hypothetical protein